MTTKLAGVVLVISASASAQNLVVATDPPPEKPGVRMLDARLGALLGNAQVSDIQNFSAGISAAIGYRFGDVTIHALADYYRVGDDPSEILMPRARGRASRLGAAARYSFAHTDPDNRLALDFWGELGGGYEHIAWLGGGVLDRPSGEVAVGIDAGRRSDADTSGHHSEIGYFMAFRTHIAEAPDMDGAVATCAGPCTRATTPPRTDVTMFFEMGVHWGR